MNTLHRLDHLLFRLVSALAQALLWVAVAAGFFQVVARFVLHAPLDWSEVLTRAVIIWSVLLGVALAFRAGAMISVEFLRGLLPPTPRRWLEHLVSAGCLGFMVFLAWVGAQMTYRVRFQSVAGLDISISWVYLAIPVGATLAAVAILARWLSPHAPSATEEAPPEALG